MKTTVVRALLALAGGVVCAHAASAASLNGVGEVVGSGSLSGGWGSLFRRVHAAYSALLEGPRLHRLDGNLDGRGSFLQIKNYINADYEFAPGWKAEVGGEFRQYFRPEDPKRPDRADFEARDPTIGVSRRNWVDNGSFTLSARGRYSLPVSADTRARRGRAFDTGHGGLNLLALPNWRFLDGRLSFACPLELWMNFAARPIPTREILSLKVKGQMAWQVGSRWAARLEYSSGDLRRTAQGHWSKLNDANLGHKVSLAASYAPNKKLLLSPALAWGRDHWLLRKPEVTFFASYSFL